MTKSEHRGDDRSRQGQPSTSYTGHEHGDGLARVLSDMARSLQGAGSLEDTLGAIVSAAAHRAGRRPCGIDSGSGPAQGEHPRRHR